MRPFAATLYAAIANAVQAQVTALVTFWGGTVLGVRAPDPGPVAADQGAAPAEQGGRLGASGSGGSA